MTAIIVQLRQNLRAAGAARWPQIAVESGVSKNLPRKIAYGDRANPGVLTIQPLIDYFDQVKSGQRTLPAPTAQASNSPAAVAQA